MLKNISNLGSVLNKSEQINIKGGRGFESISDASDGNGFCRCLNKVGSESSSCSSADECSNFCTGSGFIYVG